MILSAVAAMAENRVIGYCGGLPWKGKLPSDMKRFRALTWGHAVIMGRGTFISLGKPLAHRKNIILTRSYEFCAQGCSVAHSRHEALCLAGEGGETEAFVIGGARVYQEMLPYCSRIYLTIIHASFQGDTFFPELDQGMWEEDKKKTHHSPADHENTHPCSFHVFERMPGYGIVWS